MDSSNFVQQSPILLSAQAVLPNRNGARAGVSDTTRLQNPFNGPMLLDEIRFRCTESMGPLLVQLMLGNIHLTHGSVPVSLLGKVLNPGLEPSAVSQTCRTWRLPEPLWIPPGGFLQPIFSHDTAIGSFGSTVFVTYVGRPLTQNAPKPDKYIVPWVASYTTPIITLVDGADTPPYPTFSFESTEADLINPYNVPLRVQRICGQVQSEGLPDSVVNGSLATALTTLRMVDNIGRIVIRDQTPFENVIKPLDNSWIVKATLPPQGFLKAMVQTDFSSLPANFGNVSSVQTRLVMIGCREVR